MVKVTFMTVNEVYIIQLALMRLTLIFLLHGQAGGRLSGVFVVTLVDTSSGSMKWESSQESL